MNIFEDQKFFMNICGQQPSQEMADLYKSLIDEEYQELLDAWKDRDGSLENTAEIADACIDIIYVVSGLMHSMGLNPKAFWDEVQRSNLSKAVRLADGSYQIIRRDDGKIQKPETYSKPDLIGVLRDQ